MIDTHVHIIDPSRFAFPANTAGYVPQADEIGPLEALLAELDAHGVKRAIAVQPSVYADDDAILLHAFERAPERLRLIANLTNHTGQVKRISETTGLVGARLNLTDYHAQGSSSEIRRDANAVLEAGLVLQIQAAAEQLPQLLANLREGPVIIDHLGRPAMSRPEELAAVASLAKRPDTYLKVSGGFRLLGSAEWPLPSAAQKKLVAAFPPEQLLWGSDWPFINTPEPKPRYADCLKWASALLGDLDTANDNAMRLFGWTR